ncbi:MAG: glycosyltransferase family 2 protein [Bacteroidales bacterium]|jgi:hypothetical protein|nr:glycosyltransferase family 2 protein [Bacteroidales bacterium]
MDVVSDYLANKTLTDKLFAEIPEKNTGIIVVIPAFDEPGIIFTLDSLLDCLQPPCGVEVIVIVNAPQWADEKALKQNISTCAELAEWKKRNEGSFIKLLFHDTGLQGERWGVGMARKTGMDEALRRFSLLDNMSGIIVSLDADCLVSENYFRELYNELYLQKRRNACSLFFEHPLEGEMPPEIYDAIAQYELHLRYYVQALKFAGFPWVFHTVGSALAVRAEAYARSGGMSKKQGAEDFYFIQKLIPAGGYCSLNTATVYPSPRVSERVPFGTGPVMARLINDHDDYLTYDIAGFIYLKELFDRVLIFYNTGVEKYGELYGSLHASMRDFLDMNDWKNKLSEIRSNTSSGESFRKRFFNWFNMFRVVKYLNFLHSAAYTEKIPVSRAAALLLEKIAPQNRGQGLPAGGPGKTASGLPVDAPQKSGYGVTQENTRELLRIYREMEQ